MKNLFICLVSFFIFIIQFSFSLLVLHFYELDPNNLTDLVAIFSANATIFGAIIIIYGFNQWKDQSNIQLNRELAINFSNSLANERDSVTQIFALMKINYIGFRQFDPEISDSLTSDADKIVEEEWNKHVEATGITHRNYLRLHRINNDSSLKELYNDYHSISELLSSNLLYLYNFKHHNRDIKLKDCIGIETYSETFKEIENRHNSFKESSSNLDKHLDKYIVIKK